VPRFLIHVSRGQFSHTVVETAFENSETARREAMAICADLGRDIFAGLEPGCEWQLDLKNEKGRAIFQLKLHSWILE
jgi:tartrate dehydratase alpha subunit/fumarate hydratase class I-like protein